ncbi:MAG: hypothetical protein JXA79_09860 [Deltaproteobacteria bacterium]|nr:hypothetical protein [Deltaproteobacteria bacterium]
MDASANHQDMDLPGYSLHKLKGKDQDAWVGWVMEIGGLHCLKVIINDMAYLPNNSSSL